MLLTVSPLKGSQKLSYRLESRMREIRLSGLEGGETQTNASSLPLSIDTVRQYGSTVVLNRPCAELARKDIHGLLLDSY